LSISARIAELIRRTTAYRRTLVKLTLAASLGGGFGTLGLCAALASYMPGKVARGLFAAGALFTFAASRRIAGVVAAQREARWIAELAPRLGLEPQKLTDAMAMFDE
jgi:hypothetical protein